MNLLLINNEWKESSTSKKYKIYSPVTGGLIKEVSDASERDVDEAVSAATKGFEIWRKKSAKFRASILHQVAELIRSNPDPIINAITTEMGKPIKSAKSEVLGIANLFDFFAEEGLRITGEIPQLNNSNEQLLIVKEPVGIVGAITPSNYPVALLTWKLGAALSAGCSVIAKPDDVAPTAALLLGKYFIKAGLPSGVLNILTGDGSGIGKAIVKHPRINKIAFTGSVNVGKSIAMSAARTLKRVSLELGGQCPAIIMDRVDCNMIIKDIVKLGFNNTGQYCYRINRIYVHDSIYKDFIDLLIKQTSTLVMGDIHSMETDLGPLAKTSYLRRVESHVQDALDKGGRLLCGGKRPSNAEFSNGNFYEPTIIDNVDETMLITTEETFGPVIAVKKIKSLSEGIAQANNTKYGLAAYVFTSDSGQGLQAAREINAGSVWINKIGKAYEFMPFGGMKESGYGREKSKFGLDEYLEKKAIYMTLPEIK